MARTATRAAVKRIISKGLTGWEAGKLILQDSIDTYHQRESILTDADVATISNAPMEGADIRDYNMFMALGRSFDVGHTMGGWMCADACLQISFLERMLHDTNTRRTVELFSSFCPHVVTRKQYQDIVAAQRQEKRECEYSLGYVIEEHFYTIAPSEAREEIEEICPDIESTEDFASAVPKSYKGFFKQAVDEIHRLHTNGKLPAVWQKGDAKKVKPLLAKWKQDQLSAHDAMKLADMLFISGQQLYYCEKLPEWRDYMHRYQRHLFGDKDERFRHAYAVLEDSSAAWIDERGCYKGTKPTELITASTERLLGFVSDSGKPKKSIQKVGAELRDRLDTAELNIRLFLATKAVLDAAAEAVELDISGNGGTLSVPYLQLSAFISLYNIRLEELKEGQKSRKSGGTRLEKALRILPRIDPEKLTPSPDSLKQLKDDVLRDARGHHWLRTTILSLEYEDGFSFRDVIRED